MARPGNTARRMSWPYQSSPAPTTNSAVPKATADTWCLFSKAAIVTTTSAGANPQMARRARAHSYFRRARRSSWPRSIESIQPLEGIAQALERSFAALAQRCSRYTSCLFPKGCHERLTILRRKLAQGVDGRVHQLLLRQFLFRADAQHGRRVLCDLPASGSLASNRSAFPGSDRQCPRQRRALAIVVAATGQHLFECLLSGVRGIRIVLEHAGTQP